MSDREWIQTALQRYEAPLILYAARVCGGLDAHQDFNDDTKDSGEIGAGHTVTALYEIVPVGVPFEAPAVDPLRYATPSRPSSAAWSGELLNLKLRFKRPDADTSELIETPVRHDARAWQQALPGLERNPNGYRAELVELVREAGAIPERDARAGEVR